MSREAGQSPDFLAGGGEMGELIRAHDWASTPLGPPEMWPQPLRTAVRLLLNTGHPMYVWWGPALLCFYNDAYRQSIGPERHPGSLGMPAREVWAEIWDIIGPQIDQVMAGGGATWQENHLVPITRNGKREEVYWTYSYGPIDDPGAPSGVGGVLVVCTETTKQVLAERRYRAEHERLTQMFEQAPGFTALLRGPDHVFELTNPAYVQLVGHRDVIGKPVREALPEIEGQGIFEVLDRVYASGTAFVASAMPVSLQRTPNGPVEQRLLDFVYQPVTESGRVDSIFVQGTDVTESKRAEAALRDSEARLRRAQEAGGVGSYEWDLVTGEGQQSDSMLRIAGLEPGRSYTLKEILVPVLDEDRPRIRATIAAIADGTERRETDYRLRRPSDGAVRWIRDIGQVERDADGKPVRWVGIVQDVTDRKTAEIALRESEARLRTLTNVVPAVIWFANAEGELYYFNDRWYEYTGQTREQALPSGWADALHPDDAANTAALWTAALAEGRSYENQCRYRRYDGEYRWHIARAEPQRSANGSIVGWAGTSTDVHDRRMIEEQLRESEGRFRHLADHAPVMVWVTEPDGQCTYLSRSWYEFTGQTPEQALGVGWLEATHPDDAAEAERIFFEANAAHKPFRLEYRLRHVDGSYRYAIDAAVPRFGETGEFLGYVGSVIDISERRRDEERLRASEERLRLVADALPVLVSYVDAEARYRFVNKGYEDWFGRSRNEILGLHVRDLIGEEAFELIRPHVEAALAGQAVKFEATMPYAVGTRETSANFIPQIGTDGVVQGFYVLVADVSERKATEDAVRERAAELEAVLDAVPAAIWIARDPDGRYIDGNQVARDLLRARSGANHSKSVPDNADAAHFRIIGPDGAELASEELPVQVAARGEPVRDFEERIVFEDGSEVSLIGNATTLTDAQGRPRGSVAAFVDITPLKEVERELRELTQALEQRVEEAVAEREAVLAQLHEAQKLETLGQLTGGVAHDFNNLLTPIVGALDLLRRRLPEDSKTIRLIDGALQAADRAQTLVARLLAFGRRQVLQPRAVDVAELLRGLTDLIQRSIGHHIGVVVEPAAGLPPARVDPNQLELATLNLAVNARDAMPGGGTLTITAHPDTVAAGNEQRLRAGDYVRLSVIDTGTGMDEETLKRAIEPFFTTKGVGKGTGLGLSMIHGLAGQLGGALKLSSTVGIGTRVDLWLPVAEALPAPAPAMEPGPMCVLPKTATVLLVDDEELVRMGAAEMLSDLGYAVIEAGSGAEAMRAIEGGEPMDALVTDYLMPGMNGGELIEAARRRRPGLPALIVSGYANVEGLPPDVSMLAKPFRHDEFAARVAALIDPRANVVPFSRTAGPGR